MLFVENVKKVCIKVILMCFACVLAYAAPQRSNIIDVKEGSGPFVKEGDFVSAKITSEILSENAQIMSSENNGYEIIIVGKHANAAINQAILGIDFPKGPMCSRNSARRVNDGTTFPTRSYLIEISNIMYHLPIPHEKN